MSKFSQNQNRMDKSRVPKLLQIMGLEAIREVLRHMELALMKSSDLEFKLSTEPTSVEEALQNHEEVVTLLNDMENQIKCRTALMKKNAGIYLKLGNAQPVSQISDSNVKPSSLSAMRMVRVRYSTEDEGFKSSTQEIGDVEDLGDAPNSGVEESSNSDSSESEVESEEESVSNPVEKRKYDSTSSGEQTAVPSETWESEPEKTKLKNKIKKYKKRRLDRTRGTALPKTCYEVPTKREPSPSLEFRFPTIDPSLVEISEESEEEVESKKPTGRRNIRKIMSPEEMAIESRRAERDEEERRTRLAERQEALAELHRERTTQVLDIDKVTKEIRVQVDPALVRSMSEHQKDGVRFMWNACFESVEQVKSTPGSGCIVAHSMGLGKSLQIVALAHTVIKHPTLNLNKILIVCPKSVKLKWGDKFARWQTSVTEKIDVFDLTSYEDVETRERHLRRWQEQGGVMILGYQEFRSLVLPKTSQWHEEAYYKIRKHLVNPGPDVVIFDECHVLKNNKRGTTKAVEMLRTSRRILTTGALLKNLLSEVYNLINLVKPHFLGDKVEFNNRFLNPIMNGQLWDSTKKDTEFMRNRLHVLREKLEGVVLFPDSKVFERILPERHEYAIKIRMSQTQIQTYRWWADSVDDRHLNRGELLEKAIMLSQICNHPKIAFEGPSGEIQALRVTGLGLSSIGPSPKVKLFLEILKKCSESGDKLVVFSQFLQTLDLLECFLRRSGWTPGDDYFRLDGRSSLEDRRRCCRIFNSENRKARLFFLTTGEVSLGLNLTAANRMIIFDAHWNPSVDSQCASRICRFGQTKPCHIYRFIMKGTIEEKKYEQQVSKVSLSTRKKFHDPQQLEYNFDYGERTVSVTPQDKILQGLLRHDFLDIVEEVPPLSCVFLD
ncbi:unnamed protein product [Bemisia tabaci]|uniref:Uncharacterized protein n=1 Tax=Bemisia tabaci TaxID=7038 RepID=A0A9P0G5Z6_BEMTA|nr:unnamed protein product [Bemisia tabaci]